MSRDTLATLVAIMQPLMIALVGAAFTAMARALSHWSKTQRLAALVTTLGIGAEGVAADLAQHVVADLKDPQKPGTWDRVAAESVRSTAVSRLASIFPAEAAALRAVLGDAAARELLGTLVERAVVAMKGSPRLHVMGDVLGEFVLPPPAVPVPSTIAPANPQAGHIRRALLGLVLLISLAGFTLRCIHAPVLPPVVGCTPGATACDHGAKVLCSGSGRWEPSGDEPCSAQHRVCAMVDGRARCVVAVDASAAGVGDASASDAE